MSDIRAALRSLLRRPGFTLLAVGALALGVGATTAVYALVHHVLITGLPYEEPNRLVTPDVRSPQGYQISLSIPYYQAWSERSRSFSHWGGWAGWSFVRPGPEGSEFQQVGLVLGDFFEALGLRPALGRLPTGVETWRGAEPQVVLGNAYWRRAFDSDPGVIGQSFPTDRFVGTIVGVLPPGAGYPSAEVEAYVPMGVLDDLSWDERWNSFGMRAVARLAPGVTLPAAQVDLDRVAAELAAEYGEPVATPQLRPLDDLFLGNVREGLWTLMAAVGLLLLIACANVANLALARGEGRARELALRAALGAGRRRLAGLLLAESFLLAGVGGAAGVLAAALVVGPLPSLLPLDLPALLAARVSLNAPVLAFALGVTVLSAALFGLLPALRLGVRGEPARLHQGSRTAGGVGGRDVRRLRDGLVVTQVALSLVLLVGAGLLGRSLQRLAGVEKGFASQDVVTARLQAQRGTFETPESRHAFYEALLSELESSPDVVSAAATLLIPLVPRNWERLIAPEGASLDLNDMASVLYNVVSPGYFETFGISIRQGRAIEPYDRGDGERIVVIDETMAARFWPGENAIGKRVTFNDGDEGEPIEWLTVAGVVPNTRHYELENPSRIQVYVPMRQAPPMGLSVAVRHRPGREAAAAQLLRRSVTALEPGIAVTDLRPLDARVADALEARRSLGMLVVLFGASAVLLAALGIFGVLSLAVARRRQELGVRMAVGATPGNVLRLVARYGVGLAAIGSGIGLVGALVANRFIGSLLFEVGSFDPLVYTAVTVAMLVVAGAAAMAPAVRAARTDPARVLREE
ncbi:MAG: ABC transporter permease [Gemmatimonadales bacterium]|nr:ABC transporter permease [Gemmatimonadales bacterium]